MTLDKLAEILGLSKTTVSRALAGYGDVSPKTRERVERAAQEHGYRPNPLAQRLRSGRLDTVGLIVPSDLRAFGDAFFVDLVTSLTGALSERGLDLLIHAADRGAPELAALQRLVDGKKVDGMIVVRTLRQDPRVSYLLDRGVPLVCYGRTEERRPYAFVDMDCEAGGHQAVAHLLDLGHRRIAFVGPHSANLSYAHLRQKGYRAALEAAGLKAPTELTVEGEGGQAFGEAAMDRLLALPEPPSGVICATDLEAFGALRAIDRAGLAAGRDVSVIGHDDLPEAALTKPPLTSLHQPHARVGRRLAEILAELIEGAAPAALQEVWQVNLVRRATTGPIAER